MLAPLGRLTAVMASAEVVVSVDATVVRKVSALGAGATDIGGRSAVIERQRRRARDGHGLVEAERQRDRIAGVLDSGPR